MAFPGENSTETRQPRPLSVEILTLAWMHTNLLAGYQYVGPAFDTALADNAVDYPELNFTHHVISDASFLSCPDWATESDNRLAEYYYDLRRRSDVKQPDLTVFLLPGCNDLLGVVRFGTALNKIVISTGATMPFISDKIRFPTLLTTNYFSASVILSMYRRLLNLFHWKTVMILLDVTSNSGFGTISRLIQNMCLRESTVVDYKAGNISDVSEMQPILQHIKLTCRNNNGMNPVDIGQSNLKIQLTPAIAFFYKIQANQQNLTDDGSYVSASMEYIGSRVDSKITTEMLLMLLKVFVTCFWVPRFGKLSAYSYTVMDETDEAVKKAFRVILFLELAPQTENVPTDLIATWKNLSQSKYNYTYDSYEQLSLSVPSTYAATVIVAQVVHEVNKRNPQFKWTNGAKVAQQFFNRTYNTKVGTITLDANGERQTMMTFGYYNYQLSQFRTAIRLVRGKWYLEMIEQPTWPGEWPAPSEPKCGFRGNREECLVKDNTRSNLLAGFLGSGAGACCLAIALYFVKRKLQYNRDFYSEWWLLEHCNTLELNSVAEMERLN